MTHTFDFIALLAQADAVPESVQIRNVWDFVVKGGVVMIPIGLCSFVALTVIIERLISLRRSRVIPPAFLDGLRTLLRETPGDTTRAAAYCAKNGSPVAHVFAAGIKKLDRPIEVVEKQIEEAGEREALNLRKYLRALSVIASVAPLLGLLGTIFGMITAFQTVAMSGEALGKTEMLAKGIYEAMITTAAGLTVAIPVLLSYHWIASRIERLVMDIDRMTVDFIEEYESGRLGAGVPGAEAAVPEPDPGPAGARPPSADLAPATRPLLHMGRTQ